QRDEPLFEISTDKVDAEIPSPVSGVLQEIKVAEGATVGVNTIVGSIAADGEATVPKASAPPPVAPPKKEAVPASVVQEVAPAAQASEEDEHARSSPLVRKIAREHNVNLAQVSGSGLGGRITKQDILDFIDKGQKPAAAAPA